MQLDSKAQLVTTILQILEAMDGASEPSAPKETSSFWEIGSHYNIRTPCFHYCGTLVGIEGKDGNELLFNNCSWIADSGRWSAAMETGEFNEVEVWPRLRLVLINRTHIQDASLRPQTPPSTTK